MRLTLVGAVELKDSPERGVLANEETDEFKRVFDLLLERLRVPTLSGAIEGKFKVGK